MCRVHCHKEELRAFFWSLHLSDSHSLLPRVYRGVGLISAIMVLWRQLKQPAVDNLCIQSVVDESEQVTTPQKGFRGIISLFKLIKRRYEIEFRAKK